MLFREGKMPSIQYNRKHLLIPLVHNPDEFYTVSELTLLLGEKKNFKTVLYNWVVPDYLHERFETIRNGEQVQEPIIYQGATGLGTKSCYILKEAVPSFVKAHRTELEQMGISPDILYIVENDFERISKYSKNDYVRLWNLAMKFTRNSKSIQPIIDFIYQNLLTATYTTQNNAGQQETQKMFVTWVPTVGTPRFFLKREALSAFTKQFGSVLKEIGRQADKESEIVSLRYLSRQLSTQCSVSDTDLKQFIMEHCLDDTYIETDENGNKHVQKIFEVGKINELHIRKKGIQTFVQKHRSVLNELGLNCVSHIADGVQKIDKPKDMLTIQQLATRLGCAKNYDMFYNWLMEHLMNAAIEKVNANGEITTRRLFVPYLWNGEKRYYVTKKDLKQVVFRYKDEFLKMGVAPELLDELAGISKVRKKTKQMISFYYFYPMLSQQTRQHGETTQMILERFGNETYPEVDKNGQSYDAFIFERVQSKSAYRTVFRNEKAMRSFVSKHRDFLIERGFNRFVIMDFLGEKAIEPLTDDLMPLAQMGQVLHCADYDIIHCIREKYLDETYPATDETGQAVERDMFVWAGVRNKGVGCICIRKEAIPYLVERHQEELKVRPIIVDELCGRVQIVPKTPDLFSIPEICTLLGKKSAVSIRKFEKFINESCVDTLFIPDTDNKQEQQPLFTYARRPDNGQVVMCIRQEGLFSFLKQYASQLDITDLNLKKARQHLRHVLTHKEIKSIINNQHTL